MVPIDGHLTSCIKCELHRPGKPRARARNDSPALLVASLPLPLPSALCLLIEERCEGIFLAGSTFFRDLCVFHASLMQDSVFHKK